MKLSDPPTPPLRYLLFRVRSGSSFQPLQQQQKLDPKENEEENNYLQIQVQLQQYFEY